MAKAFGADLRRRVIEAIERGMSTRSAAERFSIGASTAGAWHRHWRATGSLEPRRQGNQGASVLDAHQAYILGLINETADISLAEMVVRLSTERSVQVDPSTIWHFLRRHGVKYKNRWFIRVKAAA